MFRNLTFLIFSDYDNVDRIIGFNLEGAKRVLSDLASFHAIPTALRIKKPDVFEEKVKKYCYKPPFPEFPIQENPPKPEWYKYLEQSEECKPYMEKFKELWTCVEKNEGPNAFMDKPSIEPFTSIYHGDMWCNNTMQQYKNGKLFMNKLVDFQVFMIASIICDVIFFIWSSVRIDIAIDKFEELLDWYYQQFIDTLERHGCDTTPFERSKFQEALEKSAPHEFLHIIMMASVVHAPRGKPMFDTAEEDVEKMFELSVTSDEAKQKMKTVIIEFGEKGWIKKLENV